MEKYIGRGTDNTIWHEEKDPDEWRQGIILPLPKKYVLATAITGEGSLCNSVDMPTYIFI